MNHPSAVEILGKVGAMIQNDHIVYTSGRHGSHYINKDAIYPHTALTSQLCRWIAEAFRNENVEAVLAPAIGGVILSQWVAYHLSEMTGKDIPGVYAEKKPTDDGFVIKRGYDKLIEKKRTLLLEDVITTGISVKRVVEAARAIPSDIIAVAALCNRGGVTTEALGNVPKLFSLVDITLDSWEADECPLCQKQVPINTKVGKGLEYLARSQKKE